LNNNKKQLESRISSREVAEMIEMEHKNLLKKIDGINEDLLSSKVSSAKYWVESSYKDGSGKSNREFEISKRGCEFLAHKTTGTKGNLFTDKYMDKFNEMEQALKNGQPVYKLPSNYKEALLYLVQAEEEKEQLQLANVQKDQIIGELKPKADYLDSILKSTSLVTITQIAKDYGMSGTEMNKLLHELKVQYKQSDQWLLYTKYHDKGFTHSETIPITRSNGREDVKMNTKWTQKGRLFLYNLLKDNGILPVIEREV
jgi:phage antirepressor YoqD-like protein